MCSTCTRAKPDPKHPVVCFDESPTQLIGEVREPIRAQPGQLERYDCEYRRNGTANLFGSSSTCTAPWRHVKVTDHRAALDFAGCMRDLVDEHFPRAEAIRVGSRQPLNALGCRSCTKRFHASEQRDALLRRMSSMNSKPAYTDKHAST